jgi:tetratricopeptide (TPR) repeat protein
MSPEQVSRGKVDARADVYSLGVTLYEVLTLRTPYQGESDHELQRAILFEEPLPPRKLNPRLHRDLETVLLKALEKNPERRYASARDFAADLRRFLRYEPIHARPQGAWTRITRRAAKHKAGVAAGGAITVLLLALGLVLLWNHRQERLRRIEGYEPAVRQAAMKMQVGGLSMKWGAGFLAYIDRWVLYYGGRGNAKAREVGRAPVEEAVDELLHAEAAVPGRPDAYYHRAQGLLLLQQDDEALAELDKVLQRDRDLVPALLLRAKLREKRGDSQGRDSDLERARNAPGGDWGESWLAATEAMAQGRWEQAAAAYGKLIRLEEAGRHGYLGSREEALLGRGVAHLELEDFQAAVGDFLEAKALLPDSPQPALLLGKTYYLMAREKSAEATFEALHESTRFKDDVVMEVIGLYRGQEQTAKCLRWAEEKLTKGSALRPRALCHCLADRGRFAEAIQAGEEAIQLDSHDGLSHVFLGMAYARQGNAERAQEMATRALELAPEDSFVYFRVAGLTTDTDKRIQRFKSSIGLDPTAPWPRQFLGDVLFFRKGQKERGFSLVKEAIALEPKNFFPHRFLGRIHEAEGRMGEAAQSFCRSIELNPTFEFAHGNLFALVRRKEKNPAIAPALDRLVAKLEKLLAWGADDTELIRETLALVLIHHPTDPEPRRAVRYARQAVEVSVGQASEALGTLGEVLSLAGDPQGAVLTIEELLRFPHDGRGPEVRLAKLRKSALPLLPSYRSIDAALLDSKPDPEQAGSHRLRLYLESRLLQRSGKHGDAIAKLKELRALDATAIEPVLRLAESLRAAGDPGAGEKPVREILKPVSPHDGDFWDLWTAIQLTELGRAPAELLADLPGASPPGSAVSDPALDDIRRLLTLLAAGGPIRIHCGGGKHGNPKDIPWEKDCFYSGGRHAFSSRSTVVGATEQAEDVPLYQSERWFPVADAGNAGYRLPLPPGAYRVTLHFAEIYFHAKGMRVFDVHAEGKEMLKDYDPFAAAGFATADVKPFEPIDVKDGFLDIDFIHRIENPKISAIEIERVR